jgi:hypothetical protein
MTESDLPSWGDWGLDHVSDVKWTHQTAHGIGSTCDFGLISGLGVGLVCL